MTRAKCRSSKRRMGYEQNPPRCINCQKYEPPVHAVPNHKHINRTKFKPPFCTEGGFAVAPGGICNEWIGINGERLEAA